MMADDSRKMVIDLFSATMAELVPYSRSILIHKNEHDIHMYIYPNSDYSKIVHLQGYTGFSGKESARVYGRVMDYGKFNAIRLSRKTSIGNEHDAVLPEMGALESTEVPYDAKNLAKVLMEAMPILKFGSKV